MGSNIPPDRSRYKTRGNRRGSLLPAVLLLAAAAVFLILLLQLYHPDESAPAPAPAASVGGTLIYDAGNIRIYRGEYYFSGRYHDVAQDYTIINNSGDPYVFAAVPESLIVTLEGFGPMPYSCSISPVELGDGERGVISLTVPDAFVNSFVTDLEKNGSFSLEASINILRKDGTLIDTVYDKAKYSE